MPRMRTPYGDTPKDANNHIRAIRKAKGLTLEHVAARMKTTPQTVQRWEMRGDLSVKKLNELAAVLDVAPAELLPGKPQLTERQQTLLELFARMTPAEQDTIGRLARSLAEKDEQTPFEARKTGSGK